MEIIEEKIAAHRIGMWHGLCGVSGIQTAENLFELLKTRSESERYLCVSAWASDFVTQL